MAQVAEGLRQEGREESAQEAGRAGATSADDCPDFRRGHFRFRFDGALRWLFTSSDVDYADHGHSDVAARVVGNLLAVDDGCVPLLRLFPSLRFRLGDGATPGDAHLARQRLQCHRKSCHAPADGYYFRRQPCHAVADEYFRRKPRHAADDDRQHQRRFFHGVLLCSCHHNRKFLHVPVDHDLQFGDVPLADRSTSAGVDDEDVFRFR